MSLRPWLIDIEKGHKLAYHSNKIPFPEIDRRLKRNPRTVWMFIRRYKNGVLDNGVHKPTTNLKLVLLTKLSTYATERLVREAHNGDLTAAELKRNLQLPVTVRRVQQIIFLVLLSSTAE